METIEAYDCGIPVEKWPISDPSRLPGVQERVVRRFSRWVAGEDLAAQEQLLQQSLAVQQLMDQIKDQIGY